MKILVVDDEKLLVKGIKFNLENEGYTVDACYDGESAVNMARTGEYDLIILDLMMPKKDGPNHHAHRPQRGRGYADGLRVRRGRLCHQAL